MVLVPNVEVRVKVETFRLAPQGGVGGGWSERGIRREDLPLELHGAFDRIVAWIKNPDSAARCPEMSVADREFYGRHKMNPFEPNKTS